MLSKEDLQLLMVMFIAESNPYLIVGGAVVLFTGAAFGVMSTCVLIGAFLYAIHLHFLDRNKLEPVVEQIDEVVLQDNTNDIKETATETEVEIDTTILDEDYTILNVVGDTDSSLHAV